LIEHSEATDRALTPPASATAAGAQPSTSTSEEETDEASDTRRGRTARSIVDELVDDHGLTNLFCGIHDKVFAQCRSGRN
jgi:hypothetical protein